MGEEELCPLLEDESPEEGLSFGIGGEEGVASPGAGGVAGEADAIAESSCVEGFVSDGVGEAGRPFVVSGGAVEADGVVFWLGAVLAGNDDSRGVASLLGEVLAGGMSDGGVEFGVCDCGAA